MAVPAIDALVSQVNSTTGVVDSAIALINGIASRVAAAVAAALAGGATAAELAPINDVVAALKAKSDALAQAVASNP